MHKLSQGMKKIHPTETQSLILQKRQKGATNQGNSVAMKKNILLICICL